MKKIFQLLPGILIWSFIVYRILDYSKIHPIHSAVATIALGLIVFINNKEQKDSSQLSFKF